MHQIDSNSRTKILFRLFCLCALALSPQALAQGGPPLVTDDPDTPPDGHFEINAGTVAESVRQRVSGEWLHVDINYGLGGRTQLKYETGISYQHGGGEVENDDGWGDSIFGIKYRFFETGDEAHGFRLSTYPQVEARSVLGSSNPALSRDQTLYYLPIECKFGMGALAITGDHGREVGAREGRGWFYGAAVGYTTKDHIELLTEVRKQTDPHFPMEGLLVQLAMRIELSETWTFMTAIGRLASGDSEVSTNGYLGVRLSI